MLDNELCIGYIFLFVSSTFVYIKRELKWEEKKGQEGCNQSQFNANIYLYCIRVAPPYYLYNLSIDTRCIFSRFNRVIFFKALLFISNGCFCQRRNTLLLRTLTYILRKINPYDVFTLRKSWNKQNCGQSLVLFGLERTVDFVSEIRNLPRTPYSILRSILFSAYSLYCSSLISYGTNMENVSNNQRHF